MALPAMEHLVLGLALLSGMLAAGSTPRRRDLSPVTEMALDMARDSFDDQYQGCSCMMEEELEEVNRTEFDTNSIYAQAWTIAAAEWRSRRCRMPQPPVLRPAQAIALLAYTLHSPPLYRAFNMAVRGAGSSRQAYLGTFHFKVLHFLLSEALRALRDARPHHCYHVYRGVQGIRFTAQHQESIRFGHFASASLQNKSTQHFGQDTIFSVETCYGVPIGDFSFFPEEEEVLIPPFESFKVTKVTRKGNRALIELRSLAAHSSYNCELVKEKRCKNQSCVFSADELRNPLQPGRADAVQATCAPPAAPDCPSLAPPGKSGPWDPPRLWGFLLAATALATAAGT